eukprot:PhF_6_TR27013/c2_g1_i2/m.39453
MSYPEIRKRASVAANLRTILDVKDPFPNPVTTQYDLEGYNPMTGTPVGGSATYLNNVYPSPNTYYASSSSGGGGGLGGGMRSHHTHSRSISGNTNNHNNNYTLARQMSGGGGGNRLLAVSAQNMSTKSVVMIVCAMLGFLGCLLLIVYW